jgi:hypothetical protein
MRKRMRRVDEKKEESGNSEEDGEQALDNRGWAG